MSRFNCIIKIHKVMRRIYMIGKRNNVRRTKYEKDLTIVIIINCIGGLVLLAGSVLIIAFEIGIETPIEKYLMCAFILFSILLIVSAVCRQFKHRNDLYDEYEKNLNEIMGEIEKMIRTILDRSVTNEICNIINYSAGDHERCNGTFAVYVCD